MELFIAMPSPMIRRPTLRITRKIMFTLKLLHYRYWKIRETLNTIDWHCNKNTTLICDSHERCRKTLCPGYRVLEKAHNFCYYYYHTHNVTFLYGWCDVAVTSTLFKTHHPCKKRAIAPSNETYTLKWTLFEKSTYFFAYVRFPLKKKLLWTFILEEKSD